MMVVSSPGAQRIDFMGIRFDDVTMAETLQRIDDFVTSGQPHKLFSVNVAAYIAARKDSELHSFYQSCDLLTVDGMGVYYAGRLLGLPFRETVAASYLMFEILSLATENNYKVFLLGSKPEVLASATANLKARYPRVTLCGSVHGYFSRAEEPKIVAEIAGSGADVLFIGMSSPLKEQFVERNFDRLNVPVQLGVGGTIDVLAGVTTLPPLWVRKAGLEWVNRLLQEPRRLWKRYLISNTIFGLLFLKHIIRKLFSSEDEGMDWKS
jgi:N-acetylglucosaminyldiphosphoundecaprenol N-acetyl-beta-D-mannosaminyltransferase